MPTKSILASWTFWFNILAAVYEVAANFGLIANLPPEAKTIVLLVGNLLLRLKTTQPVTLSLTSGK